MKKNKWLVLLVCILAAGLVIGCMASMKNRQNDFQYWEEDAESLKALKEYVSDVTREGSKNFIPKEDRIAVFDMDGTLYGEKAPIYTEWQMVIYRILKDPAYKASEELIKVANEMVECSKTGVIPDDFELKEATANAKVFANMTLGEYKDYATAFIQKEAEGFDGMTYSEAWFLPMTEVVDYLNKNDFTVYICSGTDRFLCRILAEGMVDIPERQIIGMDVLCIASGQGNTDGLEYVYTANDDVVRSDRLIIKNVKANKVSQIVQEIGAKPVLSFGNSSGDVSTAVYTTSKNPYRSMAFMILADDTEREYGNPEKAEQLRNKWDSNGWVSISMKNDWKTIYGEDVKKSVKK